MVGGLVGALGWGRSRRVNILLDFRYLTLTVWEGSCFKILIGLVTFPAGVGGEGLMPSEKFRKKLH